MDALFLKWSSWICILSQFSITEHDRISPRSFHTVVTLCHFLHTVWALSWREKKFKKRKKQKGLGRVFGFKMEEDRLQNGRRCRTALQFSPSPGPSSWWSASWAAFAVCIAWFALSCTFLQPSSKDSHESTLPFPSISILVSRVKTLESDLDSG